MINNTFKAGDAGAISGVPPIMQRDWRRRGLIPEFDGERAQFSMSDVCFLALTRTLSENGLALSEAANVAPEFSSMLEGELGNALDGKPAAGFAAVIMREGDKLSGNVPALDIQDLVYFLTTCRRDDKAGREFAFSSLTVVSLADCARQMAEKIREIERREKAIARAKEVRAKAKAILDRTREHEEI